MPRFKLVIEYAGTRYSGWQIQARARTVAGELSRAIEEVTGRPPAELYGSGRTDAGVHALAQVAHADVATRWPAATLASRVNDALPHDIAVRSAEIASHRFHARHSAVGRWYLYQVALRKTAFAKPYVWWVREDLDLGAMQQAAAALTGLHDFRAFADRDRATGSTKVALTAVKVQRTGELVLVRAEGSHFLWKMVRRIVGVLVACGRGELDVATVATLLDSDSPLPARLTAPASGLFLERVLYPEDGQVDAPLRPALGWGQTGR